MVKPTHTQVDWSSQEALQNGRYHFSPKEYRKELEHTNIINLDIQNDGNYEKQPSEMKIYEQAKIGTQWIQPTLKSRAKSPIPQKSKSLLKLKNFKWKMKGDKINELFNQGMGGTPKPTKYDPKSQKYFNQIKQSYSKDELREHFEKKADKEFENPYRQSIKIVDKTEFEKAKEYQDFAKRAKAKNQKHYKEPEMAGLIQPSNIVYTAERRSVSPLVQYRTEDHFQKLQQEVE